jgi:hypothetical protein
MTLAQHFAAYSEWRAQLSGVLDNFAGWLVENELSDAQTDRRITQLLEKLREDRLHVAFVAEFSRGKSELINAIFFRRLRQPDPALDRGAHDDVPDRADVRSEQGAVDRTAADREPRIQRQYQRVQALSRRVGPPCRSTRARPSPCRKRFGTSVTSSASTRRRPRSSVLRLPMAITAVFRVDADGCVEIPRWRHAVINFPHPLLQQGLVILDTPGLNAIGTEPELTLSLLPNAHAVLFILAADTGCHAVRPDGLARTHRQHRRRRKGRRIVVLNKIDSLWDELKSAEEIDAEITRQVDTCAWTLASAGRPDFPGFGPEGAGCQDQRRQPNC